MVWNPKKYTFLAENEIAGADTINPIVRFIRGIRSTDDYLMLNPNQFDSMDLSLDMDALRDWALNALPFASASEHTFRATMTDDNHFSVTGGNVWFPEDMASISSMGTHQCHSNKMVYIRLTSKTHGTLVYDDPITHTLMTGNDDYRMCLPVCYTWQDSRNVWHIRYYHIGDYSFTQLPYFWKDGYSKSDYQFLVHRDGQNEERWISAGDCNEENA